MHRPLRRPRYVKVTDTRSPMVRLLDGATVGRMVCAQYDQQHRTVWRAQELGYLDADQKLTEAGAAFLRRQST